MSSAEKAALETPEGSQWVRRKTGTCSIIVKKNKELQNLESSSVQAL